MPDYYHAPALLLTALLLPAFGYLYLRLRDTRTLLWFLGFLLALFSMVLRYSTGQGGFWGETYRGWQPRDKPALKSARPYSWARFHRSAFA